MKRIIFTLAIMGSLASAVWSGPLPQKEVSAEAKWLIHLDLEQLRLTRLGSFLNKEFLENVVEKKMGELKSQLKIDVNFDLKKISALTAYGTDYQKKPEANGILLIQTGQDAEKVIDGLLQAVSALTSDESARPIRKLQQDPHVIYVVGKNDLFASIYEKETLVLGKSRDNIEKARQVLAGKAPSLNGNRAFAGYPPMEKSFFFLGIAEAFNENASIPPQAKVLQMADGGRVVLGEKAEKLYLNLALRTKSEEITSQIQAIAQGLIAFAALSQGENQELQQLAQSIKVATAKNLVTINLEYPVDSALKKLSKEMGKER